jgi:hypothetical protein
MPERIINSDHIKFLTDYFSDSSLMINYNPIYIRNSIIGIISVYTLYGIADPHIVYYTVSSGNNKTQHIGYIKRHIYNITIHEILPDIPEILHMNRELGMLERIINPDNNLPVLPVIRLGFTADYK